MTPVEAEPANRRVELLGCALGIELAQLAAGREQAQRGDVVAERAVGVVVLAVDVTGDRTARR